MGTLVETSMVVHMLNSLAACVGRVANYIDCIAPSAEFPKVRVASADASRRSY